MSLNDEKSKAVNYRWYLSPTLAWWRGPCLAALPVAVFIWLSLSQTGEWLENRLERPVEFRVRHALGKDPKLDPRIRIYAIGDITLKKLGREDLTLDEWALVLEALQAGKPKVVYIDKKFGTPLGIAEAPDFVRRVKALPFPVIVGSYVSPVSIINWTPLSAQSEDFRLRQRITSGSFEALDWLPVTRGIPYGADSRIQAAFPHTGNFDYSGNNFFSAFIRLDRETAIPSAPLMTGEPLQFRNGKLYAGDFLIPTDNRGRILVDLGDPSVFYPGTFGLFGVLDDARKGISVKTLPNDAVVVILPSLYSGHTDMVQTPFGTVPGGYVRTALVNSVLTHRWLTIGSPGWVMSFVVMGAFGLGLALYLTPIPFFTTMAGGSIATSALGILSFVYVGLEVPWFFSLLSFWSSGVMVFFEKARVSENRAQRLRQALEGSLSPDKLNELLKRPMDLNLKPEGRILTVMFIDIVGFSLAAERESPEDTFRQLALTMKRMRDTVYRFNGTVDKSTGDGLLCYFGYNFDGSESRDNHVKQAVECARSIQRENIDAILAKSREKVPIYPLRIGINTSLVYIGDLGGSRSIDMTLIGDGVNFAKRLESACESHCIMVGAPTYDALSENSNERKAARRRDVQIKHHAELTEAYEIDPMCTEPEKRAKVISLHRDFIGSDRKATRWPVPGERPVRVVTNLGDGEVRNFSMTGLALKLDRFVSVGALITVSFRPYERKQRRNFVDGELNHIPCEVRWGRPLPEGGFLHGLVIRDTTEERRQMLHGELRREIAGNYAPAPKKAA